MLKSFGQPARPLARRQILSTQTKKSRTVDSKHDGTLYETVYDASFHRLQLLDGVSRQVPLRNV